MIFCKKLFLATAIAIAFHGYDLHAAPLVQALLGFAEAGFAPFQARFAQRDLLAGIVAVIWLFSRLKRLKDRYDEWGTNALRREDRI